MAESRTWAVGDRLTYSFTNADGPYVYLGTVAGVLTLEGKSFIRIAWDDGDDDVWEADDRDLAPAHELESPAAEPTATSATDRLNAVFNEVDLSEHERNLLTVLIRDAITEVSKNSFEQGLAEGTQRALLIRAA